MGTNLSANQKCNPTRFNYVIFLLLTKILSLFFHLKNIVKGCVFRKTGVNLISWMYRDLYQNIVKKKFKFFAYSERIECSSAYLSSAHENNSDCHRSFEHRRIFCIDEICILLFGRMSKTYLLLAHSLKFTWKVDVCLNYTECRKMSMEID